MDFLERFTYEHVNFIFSAATYPQENANSTINMNAYKFGYSGPMTSSYYDYGDAYAINDWTRGNNEYTTQLNVSSTMVNERTTSEHTQDGQASLSFHANPAECVESNHNPIPGEYQESVELDEIVGSESRGLSHEAISLLPISRFKCGFFLWRKKSRDERCVICQMEYKGGQRQITLPCKHRYHGACGSRWLSINKACPICYKDVHVHMSKNMKNGFNKTM
ncbi:E3 ubiquitin ligase BIG BROTHER-like isoform X2 [Cynara cardunculus var. scolymus]|uniref:Zinc finger, RING/FYVE/PHD-type n=1 Tax=Cynara cardunculus var. scolymus TaxID=59895 RepID=A0A124SEI2_CYNCS|nr:E3 ubiquitin ligase BIG BROTHER-like isoform X2 [Cynara cardunculus var. scolymus]KVI00208.1 Zinc finger, RING/FYVE/PHD-type [Cynara cardunculus var. scolymus]